MEVHESPLTPFLASLAADGLYLTLRDYERVHLALQTSGPWTLIRLRDTLLALLAKDEEQYALLRRRFHEFFATELAIEAEVAALDTQQVLTDLRQLAVQRPAIGKPKPARLNLTQRIFAQRIAPPKVKLGFWTAWFVLLAVGLVTVGYLLFPRVEAPVEVLPPPTQVAELVVTPTALPAAQSRKRLYTDVPYVADIRYEPLETFPLWQRYAGVAAFFFFAVLLYGLYLWRSHKIPEDEAPTYNPDGPRYFALSSIGGEPAPRLNDVMLNELADSMGYFQSSEGGHRLNVVASIQTTMRKGGTPALEFYRRHQLRSLLILEDAFAEALTWNPLAHELAEGMARLGVPVTYGRFYGSPAQFKTPDGVLHRLEDLEDQRQGYLLLLFTDGKNLQREEQRFVLEELAHWPMIAWLDLREPRAWDETAALPVHYGIPIYPATPDGLLQAVRSFLTEHWATTGYATNGHGWHGLPSQAGNRIDAHVEQVLGDALLWAQDCAMLQPVTPGLADGLRLAFHPHLPAERIERLYALPGTQANISGLRFSNDVLRVLRSGFLARRSDTEQDAVLRFLLGEIGKAEPTAEDSPAHLAWEAVRERVRLEVEQDAALARLAQLAKTPVGSAISASLENFGFREEADQKIPLRLKPSNRYTWQRLARVADGFNIPKLKAYPVAWGHRLVFGLLAMVMVGFTGWSTATYVRPPLPNQNWKVVDSGEVYAQLESREHATGEWRAERFGELHALTAIPLSPEHEYRLILYGDGQKTEQTISVQNHRMAVISVRTKMMGANCREVFPQIGLTVERCSDSGDYSSKLVQQATWRGKLEGATPEGRMMSIGLEIDGQGYNDQALQRLRNLLLDTSSVDVIYRVKPDRRHYWHMDEVVQHLHADLDPFIRYSQLIWWMVDPIPIPGTTEDLFLQFDRTLNLSDKDALSWVTALENVFNHGQSVFVTEQEILWVLGKGVPKEINSQIVLIRLLPTIQEISDVESSTQLVTLTMTSNSANMSTLLSPFVTNDSAALTITPLTMTLSALTRITNLTGAVYDSTTDRLLLIGDYNPVLPELNPADLLVALRAIYFSQNDVGVSIDPIDPDLLDGPMKINYFGNTKDTHFGLVMYEADRYLKVLSMGQDNITHQPVQSTVSGYLSELDWMLEGLTDPLESAQWHRLWYQVKNGVLPIQVSTDGNSMWFDEVPLAIDGRFVRFDEQGQKYDIPGSDPAVDAFVDHFNNHFAEFAAEKPSVGQLVQLAKLLGIAYWLHGNNVPIDFTWLSSYPVDNIATPTITPGQMVSKTREIRDGDLILTHTANIFGGIDFQFTILLQKTNLNNPVQFLREMVRRLPLDQGHEPADILIGGKRYKVVPLPLSHR